VKRCTTILTLAMLLPLTAAALEKPEVTYPVFQFPADKIPRIDGNTDDWAMVPDSYAIGTDQLHDDSGKYPGPTPKTLDVKVKVGWVKGMNRLYFLYQASDDYWDFSQPGLHNDTFEVIVDGDASGGPLIDKGHREVWTKEGVGESASAPDERISKDEAHWAVHGVQAQNYHIFTPAKDKAWALAWGAATWIKDFPYANAAYAYKFKPGEGGKLTLEFWITLYDYAGPEGPQRAVESVLRENKIIGMSWAIIDYDDVKASTYNGFWNLSPQHTMYGNASQLCAFRLMPLEPQFLKPIEARWTHTVLDMDRHLVAFKDQSNGDIKDWHWDFGDGSSSEEQNPLHHYEKPGNYLVVLDITGPAGSSRYSKVWDVQLR
jgi:hypothetical protein